MVTDTYNCMYACTRTHTQKKGGREVEDRGVREGRRGRIGERGKGGRTGQEGRERENLKTRVMDNIII